MSTTMGLLMIQLMILIGWFCVAMTMAILDAVGADAAWANLGIALVLAVMMWVGVAIGAIDEGERAKRR